MWPRFISRPARALEFSGLSQHDIRTMSMDYLFLGTMSEPCWDHVWPSSICRPAWALKFSRLNQHGLRPITVGFLFFGTMAAHVETIFYQALLSEPL